jgi:hypothetical protein
MIDVKKLRVSLTKHGAHKIATLLRHIKASEVPKNLSGQVASVFIDEAQAKKNLSVRRGVVPAVWDQARAQGEDAIDALVLIAIIFSHYELIAAMTAGSRHSATAFRGTIVRGQIIEGKAFTNFAHTIEELGYSTRHTVDEVHYDLQKLFKIKGLSQLALEVFRLKLQDAGWNSGTPLVDELIASDFQKVFAIDKEQFSNWLRTGTVDGPGGELTIEDYDFFTDTEDLPPAKTPFGFRKGHNPKKTGTVAVGKSKTDTTADLLHNQMQTELYDVLAGKYGADHVGTENGTGSGTSIDVVVDTDSFRWFYEIKTVESVKACIRQALPQLLEYAYWDCDSERAEKLIVVGPCPITKAAEAYLEFLRTTFNLPIYYEQLKLK